jgi:hypothetical protein
MECERNLCVIRSSNNTVGQHGNNNEKKIMNEDTEYVVKYVKSWIWSGFYSRDSIYDMYPDVMDKDANNDEIVAFIETEMAKKNSDEMNWDKITDCDRLDQLFDMLNEMKIVAIQNAGYTMSDGHEDVGAIHKTKPRGYFVGYCFYHGQDLERVIEGSVLHLAYGDMRDTEEGKAKVGNIIIELANKFDLKTNWDGNINKRIEIVDLKWQRRYRD